MELPNKLQWKEEIKRNTQISKDHLTPSIALHLITKDCNIYHQQNGHKTFPEDPFWAFYWPGGQALSKYILEHPELVKGKTVLDVGSGCGASAIAAKIRGAERVIANDIDKVACLAAEMNADLNGVRIESDSSNLLTNPYLCPTPDIILIGDLCYDSDFSTILFNFLHTMRHSRGVEIIVGDPGRHGLTEEILVHLQPLEEYKLTESGCEENHGFGIVQVYRFK